MSCTQAKIFSTAVKFGVPYRYSCRSSHVYPSNLRISAISECRSVKAFPRLVSNTSKHRKLVPVCLAKGELSRENENFSWDPLRTSMRGTEKEESPWIRKLDNFGGNGGDGGRNRRGGRGGGGGGGDENFAAALDEMLQVILATIGVIFMYLYLFRGAELTKLARDYIRYLSGANPSARLSNAMDKWENFVARFIRMEVLKEEWVEQGIVTTSTWLKKPKELAGVLGSRDYISTLLQKPKELAGMLRSREYMRKSVL